MYKVTPLLLLLSGCALPWYGARSTVDSRAVDSAVYGVPDAVVTVRPSELYTRSEIDAINAEITCRSLARNPLEIQRCGVRR